MNWDPVPKLNASTKVMIQSYVLRTILSNCTKRRRNTENDDDAELSLPIIVDDHSLPAILCG